jgi:hypothetical protein
MGRDTVREKNKRQRAKQVFDAAQEEFRERGYEAARIEVPAGLTTRRPKQRIGVSSK